jgi:hypothetical protein
MLYMPYNIYIYIYIIKTLTNRERTDGVSGLQLHDRGGIKVITRKSKTRCPYENKLEMGSGFFYENINTDTPRAKTNVSAYGLFSVEVALTAPPCASVRHTEHTC